MGKVFLTARALSPNTAGMPFTFQKHVHCVQVFVGHEAVYPDCYFQFFSPKQAFGGGSGIEIFKRRGASTKIRYTVIAARATPIRHRRRCGRCPLHVES